MSKNPIYKPTLTLYRIFAAVMLYSLLIVIGSYGFTMGFYSVSKSWVAPMSISPSNDKILQMVQSLTTTTATLNTLTTNNTGLMKSRTELVQRRGILEQLSAQLAGALVSERSKNAASTVQLTDLLVQKQSDISHTSDMMAEYERMKAGIEHDLKMGLITQADAVQQETTLTQFKNSLTDSKVSQVMTELTRQKLTDGGLTSVDMIQKQVELRSQITQIDLQVANGDDQIRNNNAQITVIKKALELTKTNPYFQATNATRPLDFAFVPYDNQKAVEIGAKVYDCYLSMLVCREVGKVTATFQDEERATNPFYKTDMRGFLAQLDLNDHESSKSKTLFVNGKPLLF
jgi:hypothetical protein